jgi:DNA invertase Pin-like site-specific DNA recombinase
MTPKTAAKAYSYLRFSTPEQSKGDSLRRQTALADDYAKRHGLTLDTELTLRDLGVSAYRGDNVAIGALGAFLKAVSDGLVPKGSVLLVEALDRVSRQSARKAVRILEEIVEGGITVVTLNDGKSYTAASLDGTDFLLAILLFMRGAEESATKAKRLKAAWVGKRERAARGEVQTGSVPAWIRVEGSAAKDYRNAKLSLIPDRAELVRRMFVMFLDGCGRHVMAETFNKERIPTWGGSDYWHVSYLAKILRSPTVTGRLVPHIESHDSGKFTRTPQAPINEYYPRVIDDETFQRVQTLIKARTGTVRSAHAASIVAGLAKCPKCGATMTRVSKGSRKKAGPPKLVCAKAKAGAGCEYHGVRQAAVEKALLDAAATLGNPPAPDEDLTDSIKGVSGSIAELEAYIEALTDQIERKPSAALSKRLAAREAQIEKMRADLKALEQRAADSSSAVVMHRAARLRDCLRRLKQHPGEIAAANSALRECIESVTVSYPTGQLILKWRHGVTSTLMYSWPEAGRGHP